MRGGRGQMYGDRNGNDNYNDRNPMDGGRMNMRDDDRDGGFMGGR
jgi:hypothetical protein